MSKVIVDCFREQNYSVAIIDNNGKLDYFSFILVGKANLVGNFLNYFE